MLNIDILETETGKKVYEQGKLTALQGTLKKLIFTLFEQKAVSDDIKNNISSISSIKLLEDLIDAAIMCKDIDKFKEKFGEALITNKRVKNIIKSKNRGTDEAFIGLMKVSGSSVLKLLGMSSEDAEKYRFRAIVLKEKRLEPDIEAIPFLDNAEKKVFIEFQGYNDPFIHYRTCSNALSGCAYEKYPGEVIVAIIYTEKSFQESALPINAFSMCNEGQLSRNIREIVLTEYTVPQLMKIDPKLIILAPFTVPTKIPKARLTAMVREWRKEINKRYSLAEQKDALNVMGLLFLNKFRNITREEVIAMLNFDILDTVAGRQVYDEGIEKGKEEGIKEGKEEGKKEGKEENAREMLMEALKIKFSNISQSMATFLQEIKDYNILQNLFREVMLSNNVNEFQVRLKAYN